MWDLGRRREEEVVAPGSGCRIDLHACGIAPAWVWKLSRRVCWQSGIFFFQTEELNSSFVLCKSRFPEPQTFLFKKDWASLEFRVIPLPLPPESRDYRHGPSPPAPKLLQEFL